MGGSRRQRKSNKRKSEACKTRPRATSSKKAGGLATDCSSGSGRGGATTPEDKRRKRAGSVCDEEKNPAKKPRGHGQRSSDSTEIEMHRNNLPCSSNQSTYAQHDCKVYVCGVSLEQSASCSGSVFDPLLKVLAKLPPGQHWFAAFVYGSKALICEAYEDTEILKGHWTLEDWQAISERTNFQVKVADGAIPQEFVKRTVHSMKYCGPYNLVTNNCQTWIVELLKTFNLPTQGLALLTAEGTWNGISSLWNLFKNWL